MNKDKEINKFQPGNFVYHVPTKSNWIILTFGLSDSYSDSTSYIATAYCVNTGLKKRTTGKDGIVRGYWEQGEIDTWNLTTRDVDLRDKIWIVKSQV